LQLDRNLLLVAAKRSHFIDEKQHYFLRNGNETQHHKVVAKLQATCRAHISRIGVKILKL